MALEILIDIRLALQCQYEMLSLTKVTLRVCVVNVSIKPN